MCFTVCMNKSYLPRVGSYENSTRFYVENFSVFVGTLGLASIWARSWISWIWDFCAIPRCTPLPFPINPLGAHWNISWSHGWTCQIMKIFQNIDLCPYWHCLILQLFSRMSWCQSLRWPVRHWSLAGEWCSHLFMVTWCLQCSEKTVISLVSLWSSSLLLSVLGSIICMYMELTDVSQLGVRPSERVSFLHPKLSSLETAHWAFPKLWTVYTSFCC